LRALGGYGHFGQSRDRVCRTEGNSPMTHAMAFAMLVTGVGTVPQS